MKINNFAAVMLFAIIMSIFFACSDSSPNNSGDSSDSNNNPSSSSNDNPSSSSDNSNNNNPSSSSDDNPSSSSSNGVADINSQVYHAQCSYEDNSCSLDTPYNGSGLIKGTFLGEDDELVLEMDMGTVSNGKINLVLRTPEEKKKKKYMELRLHSNGVYIGWLLPIAADYFSRDNTIVGAYRYFPEDYQDKDTWNLFPDDDVMFITDIDVKKGWNLIYEKNEYRDMDGKKVHTVIRTSDAGILNGTELRWVLLDPGMH